MTRRVFGGGEGPTTTEGMVGKDSHLFFDLFELRVGVKIEEIQALFDEAEPDQTILQFGPGNCSDCNAETTVIIELSEITENKAEMLVKGGALFKRGKDFVVVCDKCFAKTEVYSRVVGYLRPVRQWNDAKRKEFNDRKMFKV